MKLLFPLSAVISKLQELSWFLIYLLLKMIIFYSQYSWFSKGILFLWLHCPILYLKHHSKGKLDSNYKNCICCRLPCQLVSNVVFISNAWTWKHAYVWAAFPGKWLLSRQLSQKKDCPHRGLALPLDGHPPRSEVSVLNTEPATSAKCNWSWAGGKKKKK